MRFVFDLDGTICFDRQTIAPVLHKALRELKDRGHELVFASARSYRDCISVLGKELAQECVVGLNGGVVYNQGQLIFQRQLDFEGYALALEWCHKEDLPYFVDNAFDYSCQHLEDLPFAQSVDLLNLAQRLPIEELANPIKMVVELSRRPDLVLPIQEALQEINSLDVDYHEHEGCLYINPRATNKATTLVELFGSEFVAFGNDKNDLAMFQAASYSVQVGDYVPLTPFATEQVMAEPEAVARAIIALGNRY